MLEACLAVNLFLLLQALCTKLPVSCTRTTHIHTARHIWGSDPKCLADRMLESQALCKEQSWRGRKRRCYATVYFCCAEVKIENGGDNGGPERTAGNGTIWRRLKNSHSSLVMGKEPPSGAQAEKSKLCLQGHPELPTSICQLGTMDLSGQPLAWNGIGSPA